MGRNNKLTLPQRTKQISEENRIWYERYINNLKGTDIKESSNYQYQMFLIRLLEYKNGINVDKITVDDIADFLEVTKLADNRINFCVSIICSFFEYIKKVTPISLDLDDLNELRIARNDVDSRKTIPLNVNEIVKLRNVLKDDLRHLFVFEMIYQHGLRLDEFDMISPEKYDATKGLMKLSKAKSLILSDRVVKIINQSNKVLSKKSRYYVQEIISEIGKKVSRDLVWRDIEKTRELFFRCSLCLNRYENTPDNWALIKHSGEDETLWIVCKQCAFEETKK